MRRMAGTMLGAALALTLAACGGGDKGEPTAPVKCSPSGSKLSIAAKGFQFDKGCLAAPADAAFTIDFDNQDGGTPHNVAIKDSQGTTVFTGDIFNGKKQETYDVDALGAGTYEFHCDVHPSMKGALIVE